MDRFRKDEDLDDGHLPLREFAAEEGRRSRSLSLEHSDSRFDAPLDRADDKDEDISPHNQQTVRPLLDHTGDMCPDQRLVAILLIYCGRNESANNDNQPSCYTSKPSENQTCS